MYLRTEGKNFKKVILITSILFILFQIYYYFEKPQKVLDSVPIGIATILIFVFVINFFLQEFKTIKDDFIYSNYIFWISVGIMVYLGLAFFFNILADQMKASNITKYWELTYAFDIIKNILFAFSIYIAARRPKSKIQKTKSIPYLDMV